MAELRFDKAQRVKAERTDAGLLRVPARLTRTGVFTYYKSDGTPWRELRHPDDVFHEDSLATLRGVPVVEGHPATIGPENWAQHARGDVRDDVAPDGEFIRATLAVNDHATIARVGKDLVELSCGYTADIVPGAGVYNGEKYDARQTNIRYNHVGLGPADWGRAGNQVRVIMDGKAETLSDSAPVYTNPMELQEALTKLADLQVKHDAQAGTIAALEGRVADLVKAKEAQDAQARKDAQDAADKAKAEAEAKAEARIKALEDKVAKFDGRSVAGEAAGTITDEGDDPVKAARDRMLARAKGGK